MKLDTVLGARDLAEVGAVARAAERVGFDALWSTEVGNDGFLPLAIAAEHTERLRLGTAVAIAFPRSPMVTAYTAWELAGFSKGRFILGLGTQVKGHIERRYGMKWEAPAAKLREYVLALRAIFRCWAEGGRLSFVGEYYNLSLMTPFFTPRPHPHANVPIYIAGVNEHICRLAGEVCDGLHVHPFHSPKYLREFVLPNVEAGLKKSGRARSDFTVASTAFALAGKTRDEIRAIRETVRHQLAFYASTRTYRVALDVHGWGEVATRLNEKAARSEWGTMAAEITDEMLDTYSVSGTFEEIGDLVMARYEGLLDRVAFYVPFSPGVDEDAFRSLARQFNG